MTDLTNMAAAPRPPAGVLFLLMALTALGQMATNLVVPLLDRMATDLALELESTGLILSAVLVGIGLGQLVVGPLSDRYGRRPVLLAGLTLFILASIAATFAMSGAMLLLARLMQGLGASAGLALPRAIARDRFSGGAFLRVMSLLTSVMAVMPGLAPIIGSSVAERFGWRAALGLTVATGLAVLVAVLLALPESHHARRRGQGMGGILRGYAHVLRGRAFLGYSIATGCALGGAYAEVAAALRLYHGSFGWAVPAVSLATAAYAVAVLIGGVLAARLNLGARRLVPIGLVLMLASAAMLMLLASADMLSAWTVIGLVMVSQIGMGMMVPTAIGLALISVEGHAGTASALMGAAHMAIGALGAALIGLLSTPVGWNQAAAMLGFALCAGLAAVLADTKQRKDGTAAV